MVKQNPNVADLALSKKEKEFVRSVGDEILEALSPARQREIERLNQRIDSVEEDLRDLFSLGLTCGAHKCTCINKAVDSACLEDVKEEYGINIEEEDTGFLTGKLLKGSTRMDIQDFFDAFEYVSDQINLPHLNGEVELKFKHSSLY